MRRAWTLSAGWRAMWRASRRAWPCSSRVSPSTLRPPYGSAGSGRPFDVDPVIDAAVDAALAHSGVEVVDVELPGWDLASRTSDAIIDAEAVASNRALLADPARRDLLGPRVRANLAEARAVTLERLLQARAEQERWRATMAAAMRETGLLALPTVPFFLRDSMPPSGRATSRSPGPSIWRASPHWHCRCRRGGGCPPACSSSADRTRRRGHLPLGR